jgi:hypothetical protein
MSDETFEDFQEEFKGIFNKYGGQPFDKDWFNKVQKAHKDIRKKIGGISYIADVTLETTQGKANIKKAKPIIDKIFAIYPLLRNRLEQHELTKEALLLPNISFDNHRQPKTVKTILAGFDEDGEDYCDYNKERKELEKELNKLALLWAKSKTHPAKYRVTLTTAAVAFAKLGHYGVDEGSCFAQGKDRDDNKALLGILDDTFVVLVEEKGKIIARFWGVVDEEYKIYSVCNFYMAKKVQEGNIITALKAFFASLMKMDENDLQVHEDTVKIDDAVKLYHNKYGSFTFSNAENAPDENEEFEIETTGKKVECLFVCPGCKEEYDDGPNDEFYTEEVDDIRCCPKCLRKAKYCQHSGTYTLGEGVEVRQGGMQTWVKKEFAKEYHKCSKCGHLCDDINGGSCSACSYNNINTWNIYNSTTSTTY